jgi:hypothetical protein
MSAYNTIDSVCFQFEDDLVSALKEIYGNVENNGTKTKNLHGYTGDVRPEMANIIVRRHNISSLSNDLGFVKDSDGKYRMIISDYDKGIIKVDKIISKYTENVIKNKLKGKYRILGKTQKDGKQQIKLQVLS